jgi:RNA polymerase sigma factor (sigma-70 family)
VEQAHWFVAEVQSHESALKSWLRARFPRLPDIEDIAQVAFLRLWRRQSQPGSERLRSPKAALFAIARNAALDEVRHQAVARTDAVAEMGQLPVLDETTDVVETVSARQELEFLADALRRLPTRGRQVITLAKIYGFTEKQVAEKLGISENTVRTHLVRGMERCTEYLRQHGVSRKEHESR